MTTYKNREAAVKFLDGLKVDLRQYMDKLAELRKGEGGLPSTTLSNEQLQDKTMGKAELDKCGGISGSPLKKEEKTPRSKLSIEDHTRIHSFDPKNPDKVIHMYHASGKTVRHESYKHGSDQKKPTVDAPSDIGELPSANEAAAFAREHFLKQTSKDKLPDLPRKNNRFDRYKKSEDEPKTLMKSVFGGGSGSRLGGKDTNSKVMTTQALHQGSKDAMKNAKMPTAQQSMKMPSMAEHDSRASTYGDFMPAGKWNKSEMQKSLDEMGKFGSNLKKAEGNSSGLPLKEVKPGHENWPNHLAAGEGKRVWHGSDDDKQVHYHVIQHGKDNFTAHNSPYDGENSGHTQNGLKSMKEAKAHLSQVNKK